jgi:signal transduction histidine kinase
MIRNLRGHLSDRRTLLLIGGVAAPCALLLVLGIWIIRQDRELAEKRAADGRQHSAVFAGQELSARLETLMLRAMAGRVTPADREIALVGTIESGSVRFPWQSAVPPRVDDPDLIQAERLVHVEPAIAIARLRLSSKRAGSVTARARAALLLMSALNREGKGREAIDAERELCAIPANVVDEYGVPYFLYAAKRLAGSPDVGSNLLRDLDAALTTVWLPPSAIFMIADIARQMGSAGVALEQRARTQAKETERAASLLFEIARGAATPWRISPEVEDPLMSSASEADGATRTAAAVRARIVLSSIKLPPDARWAIGNGQRGVAVNDTVPQVKIQFAAAVPNDNSLARQLLYGGALALVFIATAISSFLLYRDVRRETGLALLRSAFVSSVSHELRTPIATIRAYAEMLDMGRIQPAQWPTYLKTIIGESERLSRLVEGVLEFSRLEQSKRTYRFEPVPLNEVIQAAAQGIRFALEQNGFDLRVVTHTDVCVTADRHALEQVFINLLSNAIKFSGARREIELGVRQDGPNAIVQIRDYGIGIAPEHQRRIFERFFRADTPEGPNVPGVGLGLSIVEQIVTAHGGQVAVESAPHEGSAFSVILPLHA